MRREYTFTDEAGDEWSLTVSQQRGRFIGSLTCTDPMWRGPVRIVNRSMRQQRIIAPDAFGWLQQTWLTITGQKLTEPLLSRILRIGALEGIQSFRGIEPTTFSTIVDQSTVDQEEEPEEQPVLPRSWLPSLDAEHPPAGLK